jgi:uncharacterized membrane protein YcaP (DUF421 family)
MEIVVRAAVIFLFLWVVTRVVGRSTLGELSTFELLLYVTMGDLVQQAVTQQDYSLTGGVLAVSVFALFTAVLNWVQWRFPRTRPIVNGLPIVVMREGEPIEPAMRQQRLSENDFAAAARQQGIRDLTSIELAVLETDGRISFFTRHEGDSGAPEKGTVS